MLEAIARCAIIVPSKKMMDMKTVYSANQFLVAELAQSIPHELSF